MDFLSTMKAEMNRKRKQIKEVEVEVEGKKFVKRSDLAAKHEQEYLEKLRIKQEANSHSVVPSGSEEQDVKEDVQSSGDLPKTDQTVPIADVRKRLRERGQPILLFGESEEDVRARLLKNELEQPELNEGWKNEMVAAMRDVDDEIVKEVIEGSSGDAGKHDVALPESFNTSWEKIESDAQLLGQDDDVARDCDIVSAFFKYMLARWGRALNERDDEVKKSAKGRYDASIHKQTATNMKPLMNTLDGHKCNNDIRHHLAKLCRLLILDRNYVLANNAYMEMAIGNAPWPVGVTRSGLHQRPGSAKSYVSNIAHVLNDETQRKYIQGIKRLMTRMQEYFPTDPSKCVEFVKRD